MTVVFGEFQKRGAASVVAQAGEEAACTQVGAEERKRQG